MARIIVAECKQEVSSFNPAKSCYEDFRVLKGESLLAYHRGVGAEVGGALAVLESAPEITLLPALGACANTSGGILEMSSFRRLADEFLQTLADVGQADGAYFSLHGAMQAEGEEDPEGYLLAEARKILGERIPIVASLDLHGVLTDRMLVHCDAVVPYHTYPHVDFVETGARAARLLLAIMAGRVRPVTARVRIPALVRGDELITETGSIGECIRLAQRIEASERGLSAGVMWGNPFTDTPDLRTNSLVVMDDDHQAASQMALELAELFWERHQGMQVPLVRLTESVRRAKSVASGTVVMMDAADAPSSGASGDSNAILAELIRQNYPGKALIPLVDPRAVEDAFAAGIGATFEARLGGAIDQARFQPVELRARVKLLSDGRFRSESFGWEWNSGPTAVLEAMNYTLLVGTRPVSLFDRSWFWAHGLDPRRFDLVVVKSPHCESRMFADWCSALIHVDAPGSTSANLRSLGHKKCPRPIFPLDENVPFVPLVEIYRRDR